MTKRSVTFVLGNGSHATKSPYLAKTKNSIHKRKWREKLQPFASPFKKPIAALHYKPRIFKITYCTYFKDSKPVIDNQSLILASRIIVAGFDTRTTA